jgi:hypothetical protein
VDEDGLFRQVCNEDDRWADDDAAHSACCGWEGQRVAVVDAVAAAGRGPDDDHDVDGVDREFVARFPAQCAEQGPFVDPAGPVETGGAEQQRVRSDRRGGLGAGRDGIGAGCGVGRGAVTSGSRAAISCSWVPGCRRWARVLIARS